MAKFLLPAIEGCWVKSGKKLNDREGIAEVDAAAVLETPGVFVASTSR